MWEFYPTRDPEPVPRVWCVADMKHQGRIYTMMRVPDLLADDVFGLGLKGCDREQGLTAQQRQ